MLSIEGARTVWARCVRARGRVVLVALAGVVGLAVAAPVSAGQVSQVDPPRVSADTSVSLTGTGFDPTPGNNRVTFSPPTGAPQSTLASLVSTADAARGIRRLSVRVPAGLPDGRTGIRVTNLVTGEETEAGFLEVVSFAVSPAAGRAGTGPIEVVLRGSSNARFVSGATRVAVGAGVTVSGVRVDSATQVTATLSLAATAAPGPRTVATLASGQTASLVNGFTVLPAEGGGQTNRPPSVTSTPLTTATVGQPYAYTATATDADGDAVQFVLTSGPSGFAIAPSGVVTWTPAATQTGVQAVTIEARDGKGGVTPQSFSVTVSATPPTNVGAGGHLDAGDDGDGGPAVQLPGDGDRRGQRRRAVLPRVGPDRLRHRAQRRGDVDAGGDPDGRAGGDDRGAGRQGRRHAAELQRDGERDAADQCGAGGHLDARTTATVGQAYAYTATATDADNDPVQFFLVRADRFAIAPSGVVTWTPAANQTGAQAITIEARDGKGGVTPQSFSVTVSAAPPTNAAPVVTSTPGTRRRWGSRMRTRRRRPTRTTTR